MPYLQIAPLYLVYMSGQFLIFLLDIAKKVLSFYYLQISSNLAVYPIISLDCKTLYHQFHYFGFYFDFKIRMKPRFLFSNFMKTILAQTFKKDCFNFCLFIAFQIFV